MSNDKKLNIKDEFVTYNNIDKAEILPNKMDDTNDKTETCKSLEYRI